jgi:hypothetical protein
MYVHQNISHKEIYCLLALDCWVKHVNVRKKPMAKSTTEAQENDCRS